MWAAQRLSRTSSVNSMSRSVVSSHGSSFGDSDTAGEEDSHIPSMWSHQERYLPSKADNVKVHVLEMPRTQSFSSRPESEHGTLAEEFDLPEKTPTLPPLGLAAPATMEYKPPGPLEMQLSAIMSSIINIERSGPTIMAEDYSQLQKRVKELESEKTSLMSRHEALWALRDQDLANLIKVRQLLADERREHATMREVRDRDLQNVIDLREKLAQATWSRPQSMVQPPSLDRRNTTDMWQIAKTAAMEHRVLELEQANEDLLAQLAGLQSGTGETKTPSKKTNPLDLDRMEALYEDHARYREKMAQRMQSLRSEKDMLQHHLSRKEDECSDLEAKVESLQRKMAML